MLVAFISMILMATFIFISLLHFYWALGGTWALDKVFPSALKGSFLGGQKHGIAVAATVVVAIAFMVFAYLVAAYNGKVQTPFSQHFLKISLLVLAGVFLIRAIGDFNYVGFFKSKKEDKFAYWDSRLFAPLCLTLSISLLLVAFL